MYLNRQITKTTRKVNIESVKNDNYLKIQKWNHKSKYLRNFIKTNKKQKKIGKIREKELLKSE